MQKVLAYLLTSIYALFFGLVLIIFHPLQWFFFTFFGYSAHKKTVSIFNWSLLKCSLLLGTYCTFKNSYTLPKDRPLIIVSNHQSMHDIPPIVWYFRNHHPKFVSKIELGKGIPSVSYNLRHGGSVLIDRKDNRQALAQIAKLGTYIQEHKRSAVIFPEGTRSPTGRMKKFQSTGLKLLLKNAPNALVVPISINNSWKMLRYGKFPYGIGNHISLTIHSPIENNGDLDTIITQTEKAIVSGVTSFI